LEEEKMKYRVEFKIPETQIMVEFSGPNMHGPLRSQHEDLHAAVYWDEDNGYRAWIDLGRVAVLSPRFVKHEQALEYCCNRLKRISL
jgi:hypothetical protein